MADRLKRQRHIAIPWARPIDHAIAQSLASQGWRISLLDSHRYPTLDAQWRELKRLIACERLDGIVATHDRAAPLQALLNPHTAPSLDAVITTLDKVATRQKLDPAPLAWAALNPGELADACHLATLLDSFPFPAILKPRLGWESQHIIKMESLSELQRVGAQLQRLQPERLWPDGLVEAAYAESLGVGWILEEWIDASHIVTVDGAIQQGEGQIWGISSNLYHEEHPLQLEGGLFPAPLTTAVREQLQQVFQYVVAQLSGLGFDQSFLNCEFLITAGGDIHLMEVNGRLPLILSPLYQATMGSSHSLLAAAQLASGVTPCQPAAVTGVAGILFLTMPVDGLVETVWPAAELAEEGELLSIAQGEACAGERVGRWLITGERVEAITAQWRKKRDGVVDKSG
uniref:ATP-grasp domain-containing protein n=1 Tax=Magnetococcus massalia (strain MO-1) TaxID=451514 RepID=A0A1S7LFN9_MAGMO|nr:Protein of unknown function [Candidatus Magnetococcus massalia]